MEIGTKYTKGTYTNNSTKYDDFEAGQSYLELSKTEKDLVDMVCGLFDNVIVVYNGANTMELGWTNDYDQIKSVMHWEILLPEKSILPERQRIHG